MLAQNYVITYIIIYVERRKIKSGNGREDNIPDYSDIKPDSFNIIAISNQGQ